MFNLEPLPPLSERVVVQTWRLTEPPINGTRSLEYVGNRAFIVTRTTDSDGKQFGGTDGHEVVRIDEGEWRSEANGILWKVLANGQLTATKDQKVVCTGFPCLGLWGG